MVCKACHSDHLREYPAEINIQFPGKENLNKPSIWVFPKLLVCLACGFTESRIPNTELRSLADDPLKRSARSRHETTAAFPRSKASLKNLARRQQDFDHRNKTLLLDDVCARGFLLVSLQDTRAPVCGSGRMSRIRAAKLAPMNRLPSRTAFMAGISSVAASGFTM